MRSGWKEINTLEIMPKQILSSICLLQYFWGQEEARPCAIDAKDTAVDRTQGPLPTEHPFWLQECVNF